MGGLAVLFLLGFYCLLTLLALVYIRPFWAKAIVLILALLIPTADAVYGRYKLRQMCEAEAGLKVYKVAHNVEGFMGLASEEMITKYGYKFIEEKNLPQFYRLFIENDKVTREDNVTPKSLYEVRQDVKGEKEAYRQVRLLVEELSTGKLLATDTDIGFNGGWAERVLAAFSDGGINPTWCPNVKLDSWQRRKELITSTLKHSGE